MRLNGSRLPHVSILFCLALLLVLAACSDPTTGASQSVATATVPSVTNPTPLPTIPATTTHTITIGNFLADRVFPDADGLLLAGSLGPAYQGPGPAGEPAVYFYSFASQQIKTLATPSAAPDGTPRGIPAALTAGHWIVYSVADANNAHWSIRAVNTQTGEDRLIDSYIQEGSAPLAPLYGLFATDGTDLVWSAGIQTTGAPVFVLKSYNFASQQTHVLLSGPQTPIVAPLSVSNGSILLIERHPQPVASDGVYLWKLGDAAPQQLSNDQPANGALSDHFAVWDNPQSRTLALYNRDTGKLSESWESHCIRPAIAQDRPYIVCIGIDEGEMVLVQAPSSLFSVLGNAPRSETGAISGGRAYWVQPGSSNSSNNVIDYVDLPSGA